jgi:hypothetical protein
VGDRVLLHTRLRHEGQIFHRGATGTIVAVSDAGLTVAFDDTRTSLPKPFVIGYRPNGDPHVSHAWARTVDGAQGGTWHQAHLLGSDALNHYTGYVGQSRGRLPTHTWNVRREPAELTGIATDERSGADQVLAAMSRQPRKTFAVHDDPYALDRTLSNERAEQERVIATRPPDVRRNRARACDELRRAQWDLDGARAFHAGATERLAAIRPWAKLRRHGRETIQYREVELARAIERRQRAEDAVTEAKSRVRGLEARDAARRRWDYAHGWRLDRVDAIDDQLRHHWSNAVLSAARQDDPSPTGPTDSAPPATPSPPTSAASTTSEPTAHPAVTRALARLGHEFPDSPDKDDAAAKRDPGPPSPSEPSTPPSPLSGQPAPPSSAASGSSPRQRACSHRIRQRSDSDSSCDGRRVALSRDRERKLQEGWTAAVTRASNGYRQCGRRTAGRGGRRAP